MVCVAVDAFPVKAPVNPVEVTEVNPAMVVADEPKDTAVEPIVILLFAKLAFVIPAVPDKFEFVSPDIDPPSVIVPVDVIVPPVNVIPDTVPAVAIEVTVPPPDARLVATPALPELISKKYPRAVPPCS